MGLRDYSKKKKKVGVRDLGELEILGVTILDWKPIKDNISIVLIGVDVHPQPKGERKLTL